MNRFPAFILLSLMISVFVPLNQGRAVPTGGIVFTDSGQDLGNEWSTDVALGDLDGDEDVDAFVVNTTPHSQVWINQGGEQGGTPGIYLDSSQTLETINGRAVALGDLDGDLDLDAFVVLNFGTDSFQVWINQGGAQGGTAGAFQRNAFTVNDSFGTSVVLGDVDGDTDLDAYIPRIFDTDQLYLNDGTGLFTNSGQNLDSADVSGAGLADLDGDNDLDIFTAVQNGANTVWINQGGSQGGTAGVFQDSGQTLGSGSSLNVALGDVDNDNDMDAFVANATENIVWINQGGVQGGTPGIFLFNGQLLGFSASVDVQLADFDNDNDLDAFITEYGPNTVWVNQGGDQGGTLGQFADSGQLLGTNTSNGVALGDVDGDMDADAFVANSGPAPNKVYLNGSEPTPPPAVNPAGWQVEVLDTRGITGKSTSLALDNNDHPHISFVTEQHHPSGVRVFLQYGRWDGIRWHKTEIDSSRGIGRQTSLAVDSQGYPHILYTKEPETSPGLQLHYAFWDGAAWQTQSVDGEAVVDHDISLALDSNDQPYISYIMDSATENELRYAVWNSTSWQIETLETSADSIWDSLSLALDGNDRPHLSFYDNDANALRYAHNDGSGWQLETVEAPTFFFSSIISLAVDGNNYPHIAYSRHNDEIAYAQWDGTAWQVQTILTTPVQSYLTGNLSMALDSSSNPHISYAYNMDNADVSLRYIFWDGTQWQNEILDNSGSVGLENDIALDANDRVHISYYKGGYGDLRYLHWGPNWQIRTVPDPGQIQAVDVQVNEGVPHLSYHNVSTNLFNKGQWESGWEIQALTSISNPITNASMIIFNNKPFVSFYDADNQRLMVARWDGSDWVIRVIDNQGDVGRYNQIVPIGNAGLQVAIAYWDATNFQIKLALYSILDNTVEIYPHTLPPVLTADSGPLSATSSTSGDVAVTYWDEANLALRYAVWDRQSAAWVMDEVIDTFAGRINALQTDTLEGIPVVAYYDEPNDVILLAYRGEGGWQVETAVANAGAVSSLDLELGLQSRQYPRIAYTTATDSRFAHKEADTWTVEIIADTLIPSDAVALALDERPHLAYATENSSLTYIFRAATLDVDTAVPDSPTGGMHNPMTPCPAIIDFYFDFFGFNLTPVQFRPTGFGGEVAPLDDVGVFEAMAGLFSGTAGGQQYIDLYFEHVAEMGQIGLDDPQLLWDASGTLQNFLPGLEGLVTGQGDEFVVTQEMVDDALDIWTRVATAASPDLANVINSELAQYNDLQDFVGLSFDEWALAIGVNPPENHTIYLPLVRR